jgi:hypothetical protein
MYYDYEKERAEAFFAGERARNSLQEALKALNSARNWGVWDMLGGGLISNLVKHSKISQASGYIERAKADLQSFSRELCDMQEFADMGVNIGDFWGFADWFFDGLFADWVMQNRINEARSQVERAIAKVDVVLERIR